MEGVRTITLESMNDVNVPRAVGVFLYVCACMRHKQARSQSHTHADGLP